MSRLPDFIVLGAPKCGTTSLYGYLSQHPEVFLPRKEPHFFGQDLSFARPRMTRAQYEALFEPAGDRTAGDVSVWYLLSATAAREIRALVPGAKLVAMLRDPVDLMHAMHSQALYTHDEDEASFERALALEPQRERGEALPANSYVRHAVFYRRIARLSEQLERYLEVFPREQLHVVLLDDLARDPQAVWGDLCRFLGVSPDVTPDFEVTNANKVRRSRAVSSAMTYLPRKLAPRLGLGRLPRGVKDGMISVWDGLLRLNTRQAARQPLDPGLRARLAAELDPEIDRLEALLDVDLSAWRS